MPSSVSISKRCQLLEQRRQQLQRSMNELTKEHSALLLRHNLLQAWCESLSLMQAHQMTQNSWLSAEDPEFDRLLQAEVSLLKDLSSSPLNSIVSAAAAASIMEIGVSTIAPPEDPMAYFKHHISKPPLPGVSDMTALDMAKIARESGLQVGVQLHLLQDQPPEQHARPLQQIQAAFDSVIHASMSCVQAGREDLVESLNIMNLDTLEPNAEGANKQAARTAQLIHKMGITPRQQHVIAVGSSMYMQLLNSVMQERQHLQAQFTELDRTEEAVSDQPDGREGSVQAQTDFFEGRQELLQAQQQQVARLQLLMQKEFILRMAGMTWFLGCLSWQQISRAVVLSWPYLLRPSLLAKEVLNWDEQQRRPGTGGSPGSAGSN